MSTTHDRRDYPRRPARFSVKYTVPSGTYRDLVSNVSSGGAYVITRRAIPRGARISLQFPVFAFDLKPSVIGTVVRSHGMGFAVEFDHPIEERLCPDDRSPWIRTDESRRRRPPGDGDDSESAPGRRGE